MAWLGLLKSGDDGEINTMWYGSDGIEFNAENKCKMSKYYAYFKIFGEEFYGYKFQNSLPEELRGEVRIVKKTKNGILVDVCKHWASKEIIGENAYPEEPMLCLIKSYSRYIREIKIFGADGIMLEFVGEFTSNEGVSGLYLSNEFIKIKTIAEFDMHLDVDQYGHIDDDKAPESFE